VRAPPSLPADQLIPLPLSVWEGRGGEGRKQAEVKVMKRRGWGCPLLNALAGYSDFKGKENVFH